MSWSPGRQYAAPVARNGFYCSGRSFYVEIERYRHERESPGSLYNLLTYTQPPPLLTKAGKVAKRQPLPHKDQPGHFYCAQLLHYGLKPLKTKEAAKKQLLAAYAAKGTLIVPEEILKLEDTLRKEYDQANERAKEKYEEEQKLREIDKERKRKKRKRDCDAIMQEFIDADGGDHADDLEESKTTADEISPAQLDDAIATLPEKCLREILVKLVNEIPVLGHAMMREVQNLQLSADGDGEPKTLKMAAKGKGKEKPPKLNSRELTGQFEIVAPYLSEEWPDYTESMTLKICPSSTSSHLWASFDFGIVSGIIRSSFPRSLTIRSVCPFFWRGRESGEGEMSFGDDNTGSITFLGNGKIKGRMEWMGGFDFVGKKIDRKNVMWSKSVRGWKETWRGFNEGSYERESAGRWGSGWGGDEVDEGPSISDTTVGEDSAAEEEGEDDNEEFYNMVF